jgi:hypothetical protein
MNLEEFQDAGGQQPEQTPPPATPPAGPTAAEFQQLNSRLEQMAEESRHNRELLAQFMTRAQQPSAQPAADDDDDEEVDGDVADDFATNGIEALRKRGLLTKKEAKEMFREEARKVAREEVQRSQKGLIQDAELAREFPELADSKSELFQRTKAIYDAEVAEDPSLKSNPRTLTRAAKEARAELISEGKYGRSSDRRRDAQDDFEDRRQQRIDAQSGDRTHSRQGGDDGDDQTLSPRQRFILDKFNASGEVFVDDKTYIKNAQNVKMGGIPKFVGGR